MTDAIRSRIHFPMTRVTSAYKVIQLLCAVTMATLLGCAVGPSVVSHEFTANVVVSEASGKLVERDRSSLQLLAIEQVGLRASQLRYDAPHSRWIISTIDDKVTLDVTNNDKLPIIVRLDEITLASNFRPTPTSMILAKDSKHRRDPKAIDPTAEKPRPERIDPGVRQGIYLDPDFSALFPNKTLFNVKRAFGSADLVDAGLGSTLVLSVPVETSNGKEVMKFELRLTGSSARYVNF